MPNPKNKGYAPINPSHATQFKKGVSGNPKGRPKGSRNLSNIILQAAREPVTAMIAGKMRKISRVQATAMQLAGKAAAGDQNAMVKFLNLVDEFETRTNAARPSQYPFSAPDLEVLKAIYQRMKQYQK